MSLSSLVKTVRLQETIQYIQKIAKSHKSTSITFAVALTLVYFIRDQFILPPRNLRHIPSFGCLSILRSLFKRESPHDRGNNVNVPYMNANPHSLYLEPGRPGWEIHVNNPEDAKRVFLKHELFPKVNISVGHEGTLLAKFLGGDNLLLTAGSLWKNQRMIANPAFRRTMPVKLFGELTKELFITMENLNSNTMNVSDLLMRYTLEALGKAIFDYKFNCLGKMENNEWIDIYRSFSHGLNDLKYLVFPILEERHLWLFPKRKQQHDNLNKFKVMVDTVIQHKRELLKNGQTSNANLDENEKDLLTLLMEGEESEKGMTDEELKCNIMLFFFAGHTATASLLAHCLYHLANNPDIQQRARDEANLILGVEPKDVMPNMADTKQMTFINQILKETLRLSNPSPRVITRTVFEDTVLSGTVIPKGALLTVNMHNIHHEDRNWINSNQFNPDRFGMGGEADSNTKCFLPFGNGARLCLGMNFALVQSRIFLAMLLRKYSWTLPKDSMHKDGLITAGFPIVIPYDIDLDFQKLY